MEHRAPRLPEITLNDVTLDVFSVDKRDLLRLLLDTKILGDETAERLLNEAVELAGLVDDICRFHRYLVQDIRKTRKAVDHTQEAALILDYLYGVQLQVLCDVDVVRKHLKTLEVGRHFPYTRRRISNQIARLMALDSSGQGPEAPSDSTPTQPELILLQPELLQGLTSVPLWIAQTAGKMDFSRDTLKDLRTRYSEIYKKI